MRNKPKDEWHNFDNFEESRLGQQEISVSFNEVTLRKFVEQAQHRLARGTGLRFTFKSECAKAIVGNKKELCVSYQFFSLDDKFYIFPETSPHTNRYDSRYNRVEFYIPIEKVLSPAKCEEMEAKYLKPVDPHPPGKFMERSQPEQGDLFVTSETEGKFFCTGGRKD